MSKTTFLLSVDQIVVYFLIDLLFLINLSFTLNATASTDAYIRHPLLIQLNSQF
jgi:hypothetical protein